MTFGPAINCLACGHTWTLGRTMTPGDNLTYAYDVEEACPECGAIDRSIRSGDTFSVLEDGSVRRLALALRPEGATWQDYQRLADTLRGAADAGATPQEVADAVGEGSPFSALAAWIKAHPDRSLNLLALLVMVLGIVLANTKSSPEQPAQTVIVNVQVHNEQPSEDTIRQAIEEALKQHEEAQDDE